MQSLASLIAEPGVTSSILARPNTFVEIDYEIFSVVSYKEKYVHEELVNSLVYACPGKKCG